MADPSRVITRFFLPGAESRAGAIVDQVATLGDDEVASLLTEVFARFSWRHKDIEEVLLRQPQGLALSPDANILYIADTRNHAIRA
ncbi:MAG: glycosidase, partial [Planctomycetes bacterium]|nr:glycosidase [Planctomycetota bacterium]